MIGKKNSNKASECHKEKCMLWIKAKPSSCLLRIYLHYEFLREASEYKEVQDVEKTTRSIIDKDRKNIPYG